MRNKSSDDPPLSYEQDEHASEDQVEQETDHELVQKCSDGRLRVEVGHDHLLHEIAGGVLYALREVLVSGIQQPAATQAARNTSRNTHRKVAAYERAPKEGDLRVFCIGSPILHAFRGGRWKQATWQDLRDALRDRVVFWELGPSDPKGVKRPTRGEIVFERTLWHYSKTVLKETLRIGNLHGWTGYPTSVDGSSTKFQIAAISGSAMIHGRMSQDHSYTTEAS